MTQVGSNRNCCEYNIKDYYVCLSSTPQRITTKFETETKFCKQLEKVDLSIMTRINIDSYTFQGIRVEHQKLSIISNKHIFIYLQRPIVDCILVSMIPIMWVRLLVPVNITSSIYYNHYHILVILVLMTSV